MVEAPLFTEKQALEQLAAENWSRQGKLLVSQDTYSSAAANQYLESLNQETRDRIKLRTERASSSNARSQARRLVMDAHAAENLFPQDALNIVAENPVQTR